ncbi:lytic transglycosylase domain-containing protein [Capillibacterium thermochitinicola]|nr:transglycosylase SLT domain-containing protein [Capillibacterium thermochitinicola]
MMKMIEEKNELQKQLFQTMLSFCLTIFVALGCFASYIINTEKKLHSLTERMEAIESALTRLTDELEVVHEVFYEAQKIKDHIQKRSRISAQQATEVTYAILHCAYQNKLNPFLLVAIAETESSFYPHAVGRVGERGLVQVRYGTFKMMMKEGDFYHWRDTLQAGAKYLVYLLRRFNGNIVLALAGYNAGPNRTRERLMQIGAPYVKKVETNYARIVRNNHYVQMVYGQSLTAAGWAGESWA